MGRNRKIYLLFLNCKKTKQLLLHTNEISKDTKIYNFSAAWLAQSLCGIKVNTNPCILRLILLRPLFGLKWRVLNVV